MGQKRMTVPEVLNRSYRHSDGMETYLKALFAEQASFLLKSLFMGLGQPYPTAPANLPIENASFCLHPNCFSYWYCRPALCMEVFQAALTHEPDEKKVPWLPTSLSRVPSSPAKLASRKATNFSAGSSFLPWLWMRRPLKPASLVTGFFFFYSQIRCL